jgi:hypothetical protein
MKQKLIMIASTLAAVGFLGRDQIKTIASKYVPGMDTVSTVKPVTEVYAVDTLLEKSKNSISSIGAKNVKSDSIILTRVEKTVSKIENLNHAVKVLKKENKELRAKLNDTDNVDGHFGLLPIATEVTGE